MRILDWERLDENGRRAALARPCLQSAADTIDLARDVIDVVRRRGDDAVREYTRRFDDVELQSLAVSGEEFAQARQALTHMHILALERAITNVRKFHQAQSQAAIGLETEEGVRCELLFRPIETVGLYVPGGSAPLASTVIMLAVPAAIAGCRRRILCSPPSYRGDAHPAILVAAELCGVETVFKVGGAQAIAALAYGTQTIPKVDKIFGPGNKWVTAAKCLVANDPEGVPCDMPAGPSEVLVIADETARADFVAADLLAQAEHDPLAQTILITPNSELAHCVAAVIESAVGKLQRRSILTQSLSFCRCILVPDLQTAVVVSNNYAPEHLLLQVREPRRWLPAVRHAGAVFLGPWSPEALGDYCTGANHVLPTYGHGRAMSGLTVRDFTKTISVQEVTSSGVRALGPTAVTLASLEGLDAHAQAVTLRLTALSGIDL